MTHAIKTYQFMRTQCGAYPLDACADAAQFHGVSVQALATALIEAGIDTRRLSII